MPRLKMILAYVGTNYKGWQIQAWKDRPHPPTIQAEVERAVSEITGTKTHVQAAGRTDSGVHAFGQVVHCDIPAHRAGIDWQRAMHTSLPHDIRVVRAELAPDTFDACFGATQKAYAYRLWLNERFTPPHLYPFVWSCGPLDLRPIRRAIPELTGTRNFASLQNTGTVLQTTIRTIFSITLASPDPDELVITFTADGFLKQMVRNLTGLLVACGRHKFEPDAILALLEAKDRKLGPITAPAKGLSLMRVWYEPRLEAADPGTRKL